jgi:hypothetical protein
LQLLKLDLEIRKVLCTLKPEKKSIAGIPAMLDVLLYKL